MSSNTNKMFTKEQLFACLEYDEIEVSADTINEAKNNDGQALRYIGFEYKNKKEDYSKAMAWYRLAANQNNSDAYNSIGVLYNNELGVSRDYFTVMEYYLKAARDDNIHAMSNIAVKFLNGQGVAINKYKALEWFTKYGKEPEQAKRLNQEGIHLTEEDKNKTIYQLAYEADDILREERMKKESKLKEENEELKKAKSSNEQEMENLRKEYQTLQIESQEKQQQILALQHEKELLKQSNDSYDKQLKEKDEIIKYLKVTTDTLQTLVQSSTNESKEQYF